MMTQVELFLYHIHSFLFASTVAVTLHGTAEIVAIIVTALEVLHLLLLAKIIL
jgi:hypothetical protein